MARTRGGAAKKAGGNAPQRETVQKNTPSRAGVTKAKNGNKTGPKNAVSRRPVPERQGSTKDSVQMMPGSSYDQQGAQEVAMDSDLEGNSATGDEGFGVEPEGNSATDDEGFGVEPEGNGARFDEGFGLLENIESIIQEIRGNRQEIEDNLEENEQSLAEFEDFYRLYKDLYIFCHFVFLWLRTMNYAWDTYSGSMTEN
ncbi:hypothetical protein JTE90_018922 [Oedothorax gibbosus]|uniref:Uncharacterized protein n=1 Tax=Oedothorax gibbosus TaxID=931172 RepID=A0AAV6VVL5_9ARAC|nr:hypothetical protein JTE90_018922 [Oedothorax gibbosus]